MRRPRCRAALKIMAELAVDKAQAWYDRTRSRRAWFALEGARRKALALA